MRYYFLGLLLLLCSAVLGQEGYYFMKAGDTVYCDFRKVFPRGIKVKTEKKGAISFEADEIGGFVKDGIPFVAKKILNQKKNPFIFLPDDKTDRRYEYSDPNLVMISGHGVTFYELEEFGGVSQYGRTVTISFYIENDSLGLTKVPYMKGIGGADQTEVIDALYNYLKGNEAVEKKLNAGESWRMFNYKGIRKLIEEFMGKEMAD